MPTRRATLLTVAVVLASLSLAACSDNDTDDATSTSPTSAVPPTTSASSATTTSPATAAEQPETAVWPFASGTTRFSDPVAVASSFATDYLGFVDPVVGTFQEGDSRSGEVEIRPRADGPATTVFVRQLTDDDSWWVLGCAAPSIELTEPGALVAISSPVTLSGQSTAFEANVNVEIRQDESIAPLAQDFVMGGSMGEMGPFSKAIAFDPPTAPAGAVVLRTFSMEDGATDEAAVLRVAFAP